LIKPSESAPDKAFTRSAQKPSEKPMPFFASPAPLAGAEKSGADRGFNRQLNIFILQVIYELPPLLYDTDAGCGKAVIEGEKTWILC
jgi:hypothetical protein